MGHGETNNDEALGVPLNDLAISVLQRRMGEQSEHVFAYKGKSLGQVNTSTWRAALKRAGITDFRWHDLRHTRGELAPAERRAHLGAAGVRRLEVGSDGAPLRAQCR